MIIRGSGALVVVALATLAGCAHGPIRGQLALPSRPPQPATLSYESSLFGKTGKFWTTLPTGETFTGPYVLDPLAPDKIMASTLAGDRGNSMACLFRLKEPGVGPDSGGSVRCEVSTGGNFTADF
jgi:hypothetical protein